MFNELNKATIDLALQDIRFLSRNQMAPSSSTFTRVLVLVAAAGANAASPLKASLHGGEAEWRCCV